MNEIRMYVESLFEGKVLTRENIDLKEEIYGNLVARYEDYVAAGMTEREALATTKASMTSVDDVLGEDASQAGVSQGEQAASEPVAQGDAPESAAEPPVSEMPPGAPLPPSAGVAERFANMQPLNSTRSRAKAFRVPPLALGALVAIVAVLMLGMALGDLFVVDDDHDGYAQHPQQGVVTGAVVEDGDEGHDSDGSLDGTSAHAVPEVKGDLIAGIESENAQSLAVDQGLLDQKASEVTALAGKGLSTDAEQLKRFFKGMPLGSQGQGVDASADEAGAVRVSYTGLDHRIDGDTIDRALAYNAMALMAVAPDVQRVIYDVHENDDPARDTDRYAFVRSDLERILSAQASADAGLTAIDASLLEDEETWTYVKSLVVQERFYDEAADRAELD